MNPQHNYLNHVLNHSMSKYAYTFSKSHRITQAKKLYTQALYQLPVRSATRACSFGYGKKIELAQRAQLSSPSPDKYQLVSQIEQNNKNNRKKGYKFGSGRNDSSFKSFLSNAKANNPAPNQYVLSSTLKDRNITLKKRLPSEIEINIKKFTPGPGSYYPVGGQLQPHGKYVLSNHKNVGSSSFDISSPYKRQRYFGSGLGPGAYNIDKSQQSFKKQSSKTFTRDKRVDPDDIKKRNNPGPGQYAMFSEFGQIKRYKKTLKC